MKNGRRIFALICLLSMACIFQAFSQEIPAANPIVKTGGWSAILGTHPVLFGSKERLRALAKENPEAYGEIRKEKELMFLCITQAVEGLKKDKIESVIAQIMKKVDAGASNKHQDTWTDLTDAALVYDYFYEEIPAEKRKKIVDWMNAVFEGYTDDENFFHNSTLSKILTYLRIAYATWKDNPKAKDFRNKALVQLYENGVV
ncbi:MAG: hypothetical protein WCI43_03730, partial [Candidatus Firestonebacteria bacterium]